MSVDGSNSWQNVDSGAPDSGAYHWYIPPSIPVCDSVRLRIEQYDGTTLTSGDGTFGNFHTLLGAAPPTQLAPDNGLPITNPPVVLVVNSANGVYDSIHFKLVQGVNTILQQHGPMAHCPVPDSLFKYGKTYKWIVSGHNHRGWGPWSTTWSFRTLFGGIEEANQPGIAPAFSVPAVNRLSTGSVQFDVRAAAPGSRLIVYDALGNVVRELTVRAASRMAWDMADADGRKVAAGLYSSTSPAAPASPPANWSCSTSSSLNSCRPGFEAGAAASVGTWRRARTWLEQGARRPRVRQIESRAPEGSPRRIVQDPA